MLRPDQDATFDFEIVNAGERPLRIAHLDGSCDCVAFTWDRREIPAGGRRRVRTDVRAENRGSKLLTVSVQANDRRLTTKHLGVRYLVQPDLRFDPERADFGKRVLGSATSLEVSVSYQMPGDADPIELVPRLEAPVPIEVRVKGPAEISEGPGGLRQVRSRLELVLDTSKPLPAFETQLTFASDRHRPARLELTGAVHCGTYLDSDQIQLGVVDVGATRRGSTRLLWTREAPTIESIACDPPGLSASAVPERGARAFRIQVTFEARAPGELDGAVRILTSLAPEPLLLRVKGTVR